MPRRPPGPFVAARTRWPWARRRSVSVLRTSSSSSMTRIENSGGVPLGVIGLVKPRCALGAGGGQHAVNELPHLAQVERFQEVGCAGPLEGLALLSAQNVAGDEDDSVAQSREPSFDLGVEVLAVELGHLGVAEDHVVGPLPEHLEGRLAAVGAGRSTTGNSRRNVAPCPTSLSTVMVPPCSSSVRRQSESPSPVPSP